MKRPIIWGSKMFTLTTKRKQSWTKENNYGFKIIKEHRSTVLASRFTGNTNDTRGETMEIVRINYKVELVLEMTRITML